MLPSRSRSIRPNGKVVYLVPPQIQYFNAFPQNSNVQQPISPQLYVHHAVPCPIIPFFRGVGRGPSFFSPTKEKSHLIKCDVSPSGRCGARSVWNDVRAVPLSFQAKHLENCESTFSSDSDDDPSECNVKWLFGDHGKNKVCFSPVRQESRHGEALRANSSSSGRRCNQQLPLDDTRTTRRALEFAAYSRHAEAVSCALNPGNRKRDIVGSWLKQCTYRKEKKEARRGSVVLRPRSKRKKSRHSKHARIERFMSHNPHLVRRFGHIYLRWKQSREETQAEPKSPKRPILKFIPFNYSELYHKSTVCDILRNSRDAVQIEMAVKSILV